MGRGRPAIGISKELVKKNISRQERKELRVLADDFGLLHKKEVQDIIETCANYAEGYQKIMRVYTALYMR